MIAAILKNIAEIGLPYINKKFKRARKKFLDEIKYDEDDNSNLILRIEKQMNLDRYAYKEIDGTYNDYLEIMLQIGFISLFTTSFELCALLALINNVIEI